MKLLNKSTKGFTLIELLIVIAILGVLAAGILVAIDPIEKINQANDSKIQNDVGALGRAAEAYAITHNNVYPTADAVGTGVDELIAAGEIKRHLRTPSGGEYEISANAVCGALTAKKWGAASTWYYNWTDGTSGSRAGCP